MIACFKKVIPGSDLCFHGFKSSLCSILELLAMMRKLTVDGFGLNVKKYLLAELLLKHFTVADRSCRFPFD